MNYINNTINHFNKVITHKKYVGEFCFKFGIPVQGILHDLSKFSPVEFFESVKYYQGTSSPIDACKKANGWSMAWMHHKGRNPHHYEFWMDNFDHGGTPLIMPCKYAIELLCDYLGAGMAYMGNNFSYKAEYEWWLIKKSNGISMHPIIIQFIDESLEYLKDREDDNPGFDIDDNDVAMIYHYYGHILDYSGPFNDFWQNEAQWAYDRSYKYRKMHEKKTEIKKG